MERGEDATAAAYVYARRRRRGRLGCRLAPKHVTASLRAFVNAARPGLCYFASRNGGSARVPANSTGGVRSLEVVRDSGGSV